MCVQIFEFNLNLRVKKYENRSSYAEVIAEIKVAHFVSETCGSCQCHCCYVITVHCGTYFTFSRRGYKSVR